MAARIWYTFLGVFGIIWMLISAAFGWWVITSVAALAIGNPLFLFAVLLLPVGAFAVAWYPAWIYCFARTCFALAAAATDPNIRERPLAMLMGSRAIGFSIYPLVHTPKIDRWDYKGMATLIPGWPAFWFSLASVTLASTGLLLLKLPTAGTSVGIAAVIGIAFFIFAAAFMVAYGYAMHTRWKAAAAKQVQSSKGRAYRDRRRIRDEAAELERRERLREHGPVDEWADLEVRMALARGYIHVREFRRLNDEAYLDQIVDDAASTLAPKVDRETVRALVVALAQRPSRR